MDEESRRLMREVEAASGRGSPIMTERDPRIDPREVTMDDLIKRLREATEASRELDMEIAKLAGVPYGPYKAPRYTASLDAAMTLIPKGWTRDVDATAPECGIDVTLHGKGSVLNRATHDSEPIATCIAALLSRAG